MTEQQYRDWIGQQVVWQHGPSTLVGTAVRYDEDDREVFLNVEGLIHAHLWAPVHECRIERPVPTTDCTRCDGRGGLLNTHGEDSDCPRCGGSGLVHSSVPTREQIAEALYRSDNYPEDVDSTPWASLPDRWQEGYLENADAVLALLNGADR